MLIFRIFFQCAFGGLSWNLFHNLEFPIFSYPPSLDEKYGVMNMNCDNMAAILMPSFYILFLREYVCGFQLPVTVILITVPSSSPSSTLITVIIININGHYKNTYKSLILVRSHLLLLLQLLFASEQEAGYSHHATNRNTNMLNHARFLPSFSST